MVLFMNLSRVRKTYLSVPLPLGLSLEMAVVPFQGGGSLLERMRGKQEEERGDPLTRTTDMEKDASGASAARGSFWPMRKFGTRNKKKFGKFLRKFILDVEIRPNV